MEVAGQRFLRCYADKQQRALITAVDLAEEQTRACTAGATVELDCSSGLSLIHI